MQFNKENVDLNTGHINISHPKERMIKKMAKIRAYSHPLLLSSTEDIHPVLHTVPAALSLQDMSQLDIVKIFLQHLTTSTKYIIVIISTFLKGTVHPNIFSIFIHFLSF